MQTQGDVRVDHHRRSVEEGLPREESKDLSQLLRQNKVFSRQELAVQRTSLQPMTFRPLPEDSDYRLLPSGSRLENSHQGIADGSSSTSKIDAKEINQIVQRSSRRTFNANLWLCKSHPLSFETFLPLLQLLSFSSKQLRKLNQAIERFELPKDRFPIRARVPIFMLVDATFTFQNL